MATRAIKAHPFYRMIIRDSRPPLNPLISLKGTSDRTDSAMEGTPGSKTSDTLIKMSSSLSLTELASPTEKANTLPPKLFILKKKYLKRPS